MNLEEGYHGRMNTPRTPSPTDVTDEEWAFVAPSLSRMQEDAPPRRHDPRAVFNALRGIGRAGAPWRLLPHEFPPWAAVHQQIPRGIAAGCFEAMAHDLRALLRVADGRNPQPTTVILDGRTLPSTPESGHRAGSDGHQHKKGSKFHAAAAGRRGARRPAWWGWTDGAGRTILRPKRPQLRQPVRRRGLRARQPVPGEHVRPD